MKKLLALLLAVVMVLALVACAPVDDPKDSTPPATNTKPAEGETTTTAPQAKVEFPLEEEVTLVVTGSVRAGVENIEKALAANQTWKKLYERTNVKVVFQTCADQDTLNALLNINNVGDIILNSGIIPNEAAASDLINSGKLAPITEYVMNPNIMPNFHERVIAKNPAVPGNFASPDGEIYIMGSYSEDKSNYLESSCWINKTWLDAANMTIEDVSTIEGLEKFFDWVLANDCNGDGDKTDELPYAAYQLGSAFIEGLLGMWGVPTKDQTNEGYIFVEDDEVKFAPLTENWKDFITTMKKWLDKGYLYEDYLLGHDGDGMPLYEHRQNEYWRDNGEPERVAFYTGNGVPTRNKGTKMPEGTEMCEYISILPPKVEGYETRWYMHPGFMGTKNSWCISAASEHKDIACAWMDQFYSLEITVEAAIGVPGTKWTVADADGKLSSAPLANDEALELIGTDQSRLSQLITMNTTAYNLEDYETTLTVTEAVQKKRDALKAYESVINTEVWPRPYFDNEQSETISELFGDVAQVVKEYRAAFINGDKDIEKDFAEFEAALETARIDEFIEIMQDAWDNFKSLQ